MASLPLSDINPAAFGASPTTLANMPTHPLTIGPYSFTTDEAPSEISFGLTQRTAEHELIGGGVQVQCFGAFAKDVTWTGFLRDANARSRARGFKALAATGQVYQLSHIDDVFDVIVKDFTPVHYNEFKVGYSITVRVVRDRSGQYGRVSTPTVNDQVNATYAQCATDAQSIQGMNNDLDDQISSDFDDLSDQLSDADIASISEDKKKSLLATVQSALGTAQQYMSTPVGALLTVSQSAAANRIVNGLTVISKSVVQGQSTNSITVNGGSLYKIAALYGGTPSYARQIAQANGLTSLTLEQGLLQTLVLPPQTS